MGLLRLNIVVHHFREIADGAGRGIGGVKGDHHCRAKGMARDPTAQDLLRDPRGTAGKFSTWPATIVLDKNVRVIGIGQGEQTRPNRVDVEIKAFAQF